MKRSSCDSIPTRIRRRKYRCNGPLSDSSDFKKAFNLPDNCPMVRPADQTREHLVGKFGGQCACVTMSSPLVRPNLASGDFVLIRC